MAKELGIERCWFHKNHYDIPKRRIEEIQAKCQGKSVSYNEKSIPFFENLNSKYGLAGVYGENEFKIAGFLLIFIRKSTT